MVTQYYYVRMDSEMSNEPQTKYSDPLNTNQEPYPVHEAFKILKGRTIFKNKKWWEAVLLVEATFNNRSYKKVIWYRWMWGKVTPRDPNKQPYEKWIRKEHKNVNNQKNWSSASPVMDEFVKELPT